MTFARGGGRTRWSGRCAVVRMDGRMPEGPSRDFPLFPLGLVALPES